MKEIDAKRRDIYQGWNSQSRTKHSFKLRLPKLSATNKMQMTRLLPCKSICWSSLDELAEIDAKLTEVLRLFQISQLTAFLFEPTKMTMWRFAVGDSTRVWLRAKKPHWDLCGRPWYPWLGTAWQQELASSKGPVLVWNVLYNLMLDEHGKEGYIEVITPFYMVNHLVLVNIQNSREDTFEFER